MSSGALLPDGQRFAPAIFWTCGAGSTPCWLVEAWRGRKDKYAAYVNQMAPHASNKCFHFWYQLHIMRVFGLTLQHVAAYLYLHERGRAMARTKGGKREALARDGVLNPHPEAVRDALFADNPFFDPADLVQVRYEMVRRHEVDGQAIGEVAAKFGVSRPTFYKAQRALTATGLTGLLPGKRGPKGGHKLSDEMLAFDVDLRTRSPGMTMAERLAAIEHRFGIKVHRRSLERAVARKKK